VYDLLSIVPCVSPLFTVHQHTDGSIFLIGEHQRLAFTDQRFACVLLNVNGQRSGAQIIDDLSAKFAEHELLFVLDDLLSKGRLVDAKSSGDLALSTWCGSVDSTSLPTPASGQSIGIVHADETELPELAPALRGAGLRVCDDASVRVLIARDFLEPRLRKTLKALVAEGISVIPFKPTGRIIWLGPALCSDPPGPCWDCLQLRLERNRPVEHFLGRGLGPLALPLPPAPVVPLTRQIAASFAALAAKVALSHPARWADLRRTLTTLELPGFLQQRHPVIRRPQCPSCGDPDLERRNMEAPVEIRGALRIGNEPGGHRTVAPEETFSRCEHLISPVTGVIATFGPVKRADHPLRPVFGASYYVCPAPNEPPEMGDVFSRPAFGKGRTSAQARTSALAEAIERYAALWTGSEPHFRTTARELGQDALTPDQLLNFSERQYAERPILPTADWRHSAPQPFSETLTLDWTPCWSLTHQRRRYVPTSYAFNHVPIAPHERVCPFNPNGAAAGNCLEEAILQGFLELAERDAVALWWYNRLSVPGVDLGSFDDDYLSRVQSHYAALGWDLWALDLSQDLGLPTFAALALQRGSGRFLVGFGCHFDPLIAVERAITEVHQSYDPGSTGPAAWMLSDLEDPSFVHPNPLLPPRRRDGRAHAWPRDIGEEVHQCIARGAACGLETLVLDYSRADLVLKTVKVIVPGLRHVWRRLGPGRLYDVPVKLGRRSEPLVEGALNPLTLRV
jgi:ribosomal protein S12 methylthiotransferase accessory factor